MSLLNRVIIVTGAGSGIGRGIARLLALDGAKILLAEINPEAGKEVEGEIRGEGGTAYFIETDVSDEAAVESLIEQSIDRFRTIDGLVNNAGIAFVKDLESMSAAEWDRVLSINLRSVFLCSRAVLPHMRKHGGGAIVNIASVHAYFAFSGFSAYDASKGGIVAVTRTIALENGPFKIRANAICPGYIDTAIWEEWLQQQSDPDRIEKETTQWHPLRRRGRPLDVAKAARFLLSDESEWITGTSLIVDGGLSTRFFGV
jgi:NAD(P)-dependent dehydrogenase (short-subunit alcohol dehydrogenase family)